MRRTRQRPNALQWLAVLVLLVRTDGSSSIPSFSSPPNTRSSWHHHRATTRTSHPRGCHRARIATSTAAARSSPLRFLGPYPTLPLRFPNLSTSSQRARGVSGVSLDWVLDTAANVNTINAVVAKELELEKVGVVPGGVGAGGDMTGGDTFLLGNCFLEDYPSSSSGGMAAGGDAVGMGSVGDTTTTDDVDDINDNGCFMKGLTASALPVASPAAAGLLGLAFFYCFENGVEFRWGGRSTDDDDNDNDGGMLPPSVTFYGQDDIPNYDGLVRVSFESLPVSMLPSVRLVINGKEIPALFDTGSPITVLNSRAAMEAGIDTVVRYSKINETEEGGEGSWNPFSKFASNVQMAREIAMATSRGDILTIAGSGGMPVRLVKSKSMANVDIMASSGSSTPLSSARVYVGDLPGLAALGGLGGDAPPAAVLGMDLLCTRQRVVFRARQNEIYL
ncbi:hypothetical protein ACHAXA_003265 [Cyclostephanos tholiformis]|uniref:Peptidase A2 domain-containing protein n=1 Tax=Cyclostephanos tholiformis TaxID=382380 RepID=A0ABD3SBI7_9STRA